MIIPFLDLRINQDVEYNGIVGAISNVLKHGKLVIGPEVEAFEAKIAAYCDRKYCVSVGSGTDALYLALRSIDLKRGDEVITTSLSWIATANAIALTGATPVFADINQDLNMDPNSVKKCITGNTKAIMVVNYTGKIADMDALIAIAVENNLILIEDGSQSFGAIYKGKKCGSFGILSCISHNPMKVLAAVGEAGSIFCDDQRLYERLISLRYNGTVNRETCIEPSLNGRIDTVQAAVLIYRLDNFESIVATRRANAEKYSDELSEYVKVPIEKSYEKDVFYTYTIRSSRRDDLKAFLEKAGIETKIQHQLLMPQQPAYKTNVRGFFEKADKIVKEVLCIPIHEKLQDEQIKYVIATIKKFGPSIPEY
jgi:dTDP-4-amino-4,6-dideoxygalactose transaminase